jgi:hypothetical protein
MFHFPPHAADLHEYGAPGRVVSKSEALAAV